MQENSQVLATATSEDDFPLIEFYLRYFVLVDIFQTVLER